MTFSSVTRRLLPAAALAVSVAAHAGALTPRQDAATAGQLQSEVQKKLDKSKFKDVTVNVQGGSVMLAGTVNTYEEKRDADERAHRVKGVTMVDNEIQIGGPAISDGELREKLAKKIAFDREGWRDNAFNDITLAINNGVVTLGGTAAVPIAKESALAIARNQPGVKDVIDEIEVAPPSPMDDNLRVAVYRSVYGQPQLNKYAIDPGKSIRIIVVNGNVTLDGVVDNQADKNIANIQANSTPGVFKVTNNLVIAGQASQER